MIENNFIEASNGQFLNVEEVGLYDKEIKALTKITQYFLPNEEKIYQNFLIAIKNLKKIKKKQRILNEDKNISFISDFFYMLVPSKITLNKTNNSLNILDIPNILTQVTDLKKVTIQMGEIVKEHINKIKNEELLKEQAEQRTKVKETELDLKFITENYCLLGTLEVRNDSPRKLKIFKEFGTITKKYTTENIEFKKIGTVFSNLNEFQKLIEIIKEDLVKTESKYLKADDYLILHNFGLRVINFEIDPKVFVLEQYTMISENQNKTYFESSAYAILVQPHFEQIGKKKILNNGGYVTRSRNIGEISEAKLFTNPKDAEKTIGYLTSFFGNKAAIINIITRFNGVTKNINHFQAKNLDSCNSLLEQQKLEEFFENNDLIKIRKKLEEYEKQEALKNATNLIEHDSIKNKRVRKI